MLTLPGGKCDSQNMTNVGRYYVAAGMDAFDSARQRRSPVELRSLDRRRNRNPLDRIRKQFAFAASPLLKK